MNTTENTTPPTHLNATNRPEKSPAAMLATTNDRITQAKRLLTYLLLEVGDIDDPRFTVEQCDLLEKRFYEIRVALDGE
jgi:hypothetical protein